MASKRTPQTPKKPTQFNPSEVWRFKEESGPFRYAIIAVWPEDYSEVPRDSISGLQLQIWDALARIGEPFTNRTEYPPEKYFSIEIARKTYTAQEPFTDQHHPRPKPDSQPKPENEEDLSIRNQRRVKTKAIARNLEKKNVPFKEVWEILEAVDPRGIYNYAFFEEITNDLERILSDEQQKVTTLQHIIQKSSYLLPNFLRRMLQVRCDTALPRITDAQSTLKEAQAILKKLKARVPLKKRNLPMKEAVRKLMDLLVEHGKLKIYRAAQETHKLLSAWIPDQAPKNFQTIRAAYHKWKRQ